MMVRLSCLTHRPPLPPRNTPGTHFCSRLDRHQGHSAIGRIMSMKNLNETIWNRTSELSICSTATYSLCYHGPHLQHVQGQITKLFPEPIWINIYSMAQVKPKYMDINVRVNDGSEKLWAKNTSTVLFILQSRKAWKDTGKVNVTTLCVNAVQ